MTGYLFLQIGLIAGGILCLAYGSNKLVDGASILGKLAGMSPLAIGLTIVAIGTSLPELFVSLFSASKGETGLALGNVAGSNIFNIGVILGITAIICPVTVKREIIRQEIPLMFGVTLLIATPLLMGQQLSTPLGVLLLTILVGFLYLLKKQSKPTKSETKGETQEPPTKVLGPMGAILIGAFLLYIGSEGLVTGAVNLATLLKVTPTVIGLTIVAAGTGSPEVFACIACALKKNPEMALGNILGSNIFNILLVLGLTSTFFTIPAGILSLTDILVLLGITGAILPFAITKLKINRIEGTILLFTYLGYLWASWPR